MQHWPWGTRGDAERSERRREADRRSEFERLAVAHAAEFYGAALRMTRNQDDAGDLVQESLLGAYAAFDTFTPGTNFRAWVLRILTNNYLMLYRRRRRVLFVRWEDSIESSQAYLGTSKDARLGEPEPALLAQSLDPDLEAALARLSEGVRLAVLLVDVEELSYEEAAAALGVPVGTVRSRLSRGREQMRSGLTEFAQERRLTPEAESNRCRKGAEP